MIIIDEEDGVVNECEEMEESEDEEEEDRALVAASSCVKLFERLLSSLPSTSSSESISANGGKMNCFLRV